LTFFKVSLVANVANVAHRLKRKQVSFLTPTRDQNRQRNSPS
jgi:hypothetical protein